MDLMGRPVKTSGSFTGPCIAFSMRKIKHTGLQRKPMVLEYRHQNMENPVGEIEIRVLL